MKSLIKFIILIIISTSFNSCESDDGIDNPSLDTHSVQKFSSSVSDFNIALTDYVEITQKCEGANFSKMSVDEIKTLMDDYIKTTEIFTEAYRYSMEFNQSAAKSTQHKMSGDCFSTVTGGPGGSPVVAYKMGKIMDDVDQQTAENQKKWDDGDIDDDKFKENQKSIMFFGLTELFTVSTAAIMSLGAIHVTGHAISRSSYYPGWFAKGLITLSAGAISGGTVIWYAISVKEESDGQKKGGEPEHTILTGRTTVGGSLPLHLFPDNSDVVIAIDGYAPVTLNNFKLPESGINRIIEVDGVKLKDAKMGGTTTVCFSDEKMMALSCDDVQFVDASAYPPNPAPGQGVTVTARLIPVAVNCNISFSITGTDGYANSTTTASDGNGQATFYIPGGKDNVVDVVTITSSNGKKYTVTYVF